MEQIFEHIPHQERKIFKRTTMNEVLLLFTYSPLLLADAYDIISLKAQELKLKMTTVQFSKSTQSYQVEGLADQVLIANGLMFDVWHWAVSNDLLTFMDNPKEDTK